MCAEVTDGLVPANTYYILLLGLGNQVTKHAPVQGLPQLQHLRGRRSEGFRTYPMGRRRNIAEPTTVTNDS